MSSSPLITFSLYHLNITGSNPRRSDGSTSWAKFRQFLLVFLVVTISACVGSVLVWDFRGVDTVSDVVEPISAYLMILVKLIALRVNRDRLLAILASSDAFWAGLNNPGGACDRQLLLGFRIYRLVTVSFLGIYGIRAAIFEHTWIVTFYQPVKLDYSPYFELIFAFEVLYALYFVSFILGFDCLFWALIRDVLAQFDTLRQQARLEGGKSLSGFVAKHKSTIDFVKGVESIFSTVILLQVFSSMLSICMGIYLFTTKLNDGVIDVVKASSMVFFHSFEILIYCMCGSAVADGSTSLADSLYDSKWEATYDRGARKTLNIILAQTQRPLYLTAGGFGQLTLEQFQWVFKTAVSIHTFMKDTKTAK